MCRLLQAGQRVIDSVERVGVDEAILQRQARVDCVGYPIASAARGCLAKSETSPALAAAAKRARVDGTSHNGSLTNPVRILGLFPQPFEWKDVGNRFHPLQARGQALFVLGVGTLDHALGPARGLEQGEGIIVFQSALLAQVTQRIALDATALAAIGSMLQIRSHRSQPIVLVVWTEAIQRSLVPPVGSPEQRVAVLLQEGEQGAGGGRRQSGGWLATSGRHQIPPRSSPSRAARRAISNGRNISERSRGDADAKRYALRRCQTSGARETHNPLVDFRRIPADRSVACLNRLRELPLFDQPVNRGFTQARLGFHSLTAQHLQLGHDVFLGTQCQLGRSSLSLVAVNDQFSLVRTFLIANRILVRPEQPPGHPPLRVGYRFPVLPGRVMLVSCL